MLPILAFRIQELSHGGLTTPTQAKLAELVGVVANTIARQERGEMGIKEPLARLLRLLTKHHDRRPPRRKPR